MANIKERQTCHAGLSHADVSCWLHDADSECILASLLCVCVCVCVYVCACVVSYLVGGIAGTLLLLFCANFPS